MDNSILAPAAALVVWSLLMLFWMAGTRLPAMSKAGIDLGTAVGGRGADIDPNVPPSVAWKSHNYTHLMEQPTIFYATVMILAISDGATSLSLSLAWGYTAIRIIHSIWQATNNKVIIRSALFFLSTGLLVILAVQALLATI